MSSEAWDELHKIRAELALPHFNHDLQSFSVPAILISSRILSAEIELSAVIQFIPPLVTDLWFDLQSEDILLLRYNHDSYSGNSIYFDFPNGQKLSLENLENLKELDLWFLWPFVDWLNKDRFVNWEWVEGSLERELDETWSQGVNEFDRKTPDCGDFYYSAAIQGQQEGDLVPNWDALRSSVNNEFLQNSRQDGWVHERLSLKENFPWRGPRWRDLNPQQQSEIVKHLIATSDNSFLRKYSISSHVLSLIALHPKTANNVITDLASFKDEAVQANLKHRN